MKNNKLIFNIMKQITCILLIIISMLGCNNNSNELQDRKFEVRVIKQKDSIQYNIGKWNQEIINIRLKPANLLEDDGFLKYDSVYQFPKLFLGDKLLYKETNRRPYSFKLNDINVIYLENIFYILLTYKDVLYGDKKIVFKVDNDRINQFTVGSDYFGDLDSDGFIEIGGAGNIEGYGNNADSGYYNPVKIYEFNNNFLLDSNMSKKITLEVFEEFKGFERKYIPVRFVNN